ncbi:homeobox protein PKNOX2-like [Physella acuta]|uniref:homeobox protein PKNOX2-like n=1 Tax=Physella acuta TaxID=109671 RepID=UPI0027DCFFB1|nr:homeobox protein PKNOX2-like [Physella acuta]
MSILQNHIPSYSDAPVISNVGLSGSAASLQQNILSLAAQDTCSSVPHSLQIKNDAPEDIANFEIYKQNIYRHPLFPLLAMVFDKCENSTYSPDIASHSFERELQAFMKHHETSKSSILGTDDEVNELMVKAIQVLRIHLMEMEKVNDLCKDFCTRYITCLKGKLTSEQLLHVDGCDSPEPQDLSVGSQSVVTMNPSMQVQQTSLVSPTVVGGSMVLQQPQQPQIVSGNTVYQMVHTPQGIVAQPIQIQGPLTPSQPACSAGYSW